MYRLVLLKFLICFLLTPFGLQAQKVRVVDQRSGNGIENVMIYNLSFSRAVPTDKYGIANLSGFNAEDILLFQHPSYQEASFPYESFTNEINIIELEEKIISIDELIISASRWEQDPDEIANTIASVKSREIEFKNPPTSADMLQESGQVFVQKSQLGGGSPMIRGFSANSVLLVVDGVRMNNAIYRSGNLQNVLNIDVNAIREAEVLFGPGSVMYGSDALGGVMDFHYKKPALSADGTIKTSGSALIRYSSAANEKTGHVDLSLGGKKLGSFTSFTYTDFDDLRSGNNRPEKFPDFGKRFEYVDRINGMDTIIQNDNVNIQKFSGYSQYSLIQKLTFRPADYYDINYGFYFSNTSNIPRYDRLILYDENNLPKNAEWYYGPQKWLMNRIQLRSYLENKWFNESRITLSHQVYEESRHDRAFMDVELTSRREKVDIISLSADLDKTFNRKHQLYYGIDASFNRVKSAAERQNIISGEISGASTRYPDGGSVYYFGAIYANYQWKVGKTTGLNGGLRYTWTGLDAEIEDQSDLGFQFDDFSNRNGALNGSLGLVQRLNPSTKIDFVLSTGFRAPNVDDVGKLFDSEPGFVIVPNSDLDPEYTYNIETGITQDLGKNIRAHIVGFYTFLHNAMVRRDYTFNGDDSIIYDGELRKVRALVNTGRANIYGFSFVLKGDISSKWAIQSSVTYTDGKDLEDNEPIRHAPPIFGQTDLYFKHNNWMFDLYSQYSGGLTFDKMAPSERNKPHLYSPDGALSWYTLNMKASFTIDSNFNLHLGVENIFDKHYRTYSSGISAPGRNYIIGLRVTL